MEIIISRTKERKKIEFEGTLANLLKKQNINPETVIVIRENTILTTDTKITNNDKITLLPVISGG